MPCIDVRVVVRAVARVARHLTVRVDLGNAVPAALRLTVLGIVVLGAACSTGGTTRSSGVDRGIAASESDARVGAGTGRVDRRADEPSATDAETVELPARLVASHARAVAALEAEDWLEAELELEQLVLEFPEYPGPFVNLAIVYAHDGRDDEALAMLERAVAIEPAHPAANNELAILLRSRGHFDEAEHAYRRALEADPGYALAHYNLGVLLDLYLGRRAEALEHYEAYQSLQPAPDAEVGRWIIDLRRRLGINDEPRVAQEDGA